MLCKICGGFCTYSSEVILNSYYVEDGIGWMHISCASKNNTNDIQTDFSSIFVSLACSFIGLKQLHDAEPCDQLTYDDMLYRMHQTVGELGYTLRYDYEYGIICECKELNRKVIFNLSKYGIMFELINTELDPKEYNNGICDELCLHDEMYNLDCNYTLNDKCGDCKMLLGNHYACMWLLNSELTISYIKEFGKFYVPLIETFPGIVGMWYDKGEWYNVLGLNSERIIKCG